MDFSAFNPLSSNSLNLAARMNDIAKVKRLLRKLNPDLIDNRGWTCLHEAAANDSYESLELIIKHPDCRLLEETFEGHTALYLACIKRASLKSIKLLLENVDEIANIVSIEMVSPLHIACGQGRIDLIQMLLDYGAYLDVQDYGGDTPLHDAAFKSQPEVVNLLLHAGAQSEKRNEKGYTPLHLACFAGCLEAVIELFPFVTDIDLQAENGETALMLATQRGSQTIVEYLIQNNADPHIANVDGDLPLNIALIHGHSDIFKLLLSLTNKDKIKKELIIVACKPYYFNMDIITTLLESDLGPEFFNVEEILYLKFAKMGDFCPPYVYNSPLNSLIHVCEYIYNHSEDLFLKLFYLFLMRGVSVNPLYVNECPPLVYLEYCQHRNCFKTVLKMLVDLGCDVNYCSNYTMPDGIMASIATGAQTIHDILPYTLACEPMQILKYLCNFKLIDRFSVDVQNRIMSLIDINCEGLTSENLLCFVPTLKHLCRVEIRNILRRRGSYTTRTFLDIVQRIPLPTLLKQFIRYA